MPDKNKAMFNVSGFVPETYEAKAVMADPAALENYRKNPSDAVSGGIAKKSEALDRPEMNYDTP